MKARSKAFIWVLLIFLTGALLGGASSYLYLSSFPNLDRRSPSVAADKEEGRRRDGSRRGYFQTLVRELELNQQQLDQMKVILEAARDRYREISERYSLESKKARAQAREASRNRIRSILRPEQLGKFEELIERHEQEHRQRRQKE